MTDLFSFRKPVPSIVIDERLLQRAEKVVLFDYHRRGVEFIDNTLLVYLEPYASSTAELMTELIEYQPKHDKMTMLEATSMLGARYRRVRSEQDKRPMISGLRESGSIEQDADSVFFLYREDYYDNETENQNMLEITIAMQCNGPTDAVTLTFVKEFNKFVKIDWSQHTAPPAP